MQSSKWIEQTLNEGQLSLDCNCTSAPKRVGGGEHRQNIIPVFQSKYCGNM